MRGMGIPVGEGVTHGGQGCPLATIATSDVEAEAEAGSGSAGSGFFLWKRKL